MKLKIKMLHNMIKLSVIVLTLLLPFACQENDVIAAQDLIATENLIDYDQIGVEHNEGLDATFEALKAMKTSNELSKDNLGNYYDILEKATIDFSLQRHSELSDLSVKELRKNVRNIKNSLNAYTIGLDLENENIHLHDQMLSEVQHLLTPNQNRYLRRIMEITTTGNDGIDSILESLSSLETEIKANSSEDDLPVLLTSLSIAKHSSQYWSDNFSKWANEFGVSPSFGRVKGHINWNVVGGADIAAGVIVGVGTSTALIIPFVGWGAWAAITGGSAVIGSAGTALLFVYTSSYQTNVSYSQSNYNISTVWNF